MCDRLHSYEEAFQSREISSATKRYLCLLPTSLLNADAFASVIAEDLGWTLWTPAGLALNLWRLRTIEKDTDEDNPGDVEQRDASVIITQTIEKDTDEDNPGDVKQRDASVIITQVSFPLPLVEMDDGRVFEILRNVSLAPHLLGEFCEFCHQLGLAVLEDFRWDYVGSWFLTAGNLLQDQYGFW
ncbi:unnamed protein product [Schistocephalus solidus]|uniref:Uncharacterized protein n=1 Tax=Schistocephalus solidus TaxID=70667 RepID=A0A3P7DF20_SCHSO|nr:unnamed protein product [Schistocephalus solidus]